MIGIVLVAHSEKLAQGIRDIVLQMVGDDAPIAAAGGTDNPDSPIGADPIRVMSAIESVYSDDGVLVLMDLGSAIMSAEAAIEFLPPEQQDYIFLCEAPLVEGAIAAAVQAMGGSDMARVMAEARGALAAKTAQLEPILHIKPPPSQVSASPVDRSTASTEAHAITLITPNRLGLHARPAAKLVTILNRFQADVRITKGERTVNAHSLNQVVTLGAKRGDELTFHAAGRDALVALAAIVALAEENFGDDDIDAAADVAISDVVGGVDGGVDDELRGVPAADGVAIGPVFRHQPALPPVMERTAEAPPVEWERLEAAIAGALAELEQIRTVTKEQAGGAQAAIFDAQILMLQDPELHARAQQLLFPSAPSFDTESISADAAWRQVIEEVAAAYRRLDDAYLQARVADVIDVGRRVLRRLTGVGAAPLILERPSILVARELTPSDAATLDPNQVLGVITERGGATSHSAILARALGIPAVTGVVGALERLLDGQVIGLDGERGRVWPAPDEERLRELRAQRSRWLEQRTAARQEGEKPAVTQDGRTIEVAANISGPDEIPGALANGAEGVGLFRTEFLFMGRSAAPDEDEQAAAYAQIAAALAGRPLIVRTLDVGGDKPIPYLDAGAEANPFLGRRGIRYCLDHPALFKTQLRALLRAGADHPLKIMLPMVSVVEEVARVKELLAEAQDELKSEGVPFALPLELGVMIETPAAVLAADRLAQEVNFFSIGSNDLTQYIMAADRANAGVAGLASPFQPAVLRAMDQVVQAGHEAGLWVGLCGELAANVTVVPLLVGLGLDELSMSSPAIPQVKQAIRNLTVRRATEIARRALSLSSAAAVEASLMGCRSDGLD